MSDVFFGFLGLSEAAVFTESLQHTEQVQDLSINSRPNLAPYVGAHWLSQ